MKLSLSVKRIIGGYRGFRIINEPWLMKKKQAKAASAISVNDATEQTQ